MTKENTYKCWIYSPDHDAKIVDMKEGGKPPKGWYDSPAKFPKPKPEKKDK